MQVTDAALRNYPSLPPSLLHLINRPLEDGDEMGRDYDD